MESMREIENKSSFIGGQKSICILSNALLLYSRIPGGNNLVNRIFFEK
jgi:hypothetical protein